MGCKPLGTASRSEVFLLASLMMAVANRRACGSFDPALSAAYLPSL